MVGMQARTSEATASLVQKTSSSLHASSKVICDNLGRTTLFTKGCNLSGAWKEQLNRQFINLA